LSVSYADHPVAVKHAVVPAIRPPSAAAAPALPTREAYLAPLRRLIPRLRQMIGPLPWILPGDRAGMGRGPNPPLHRQQAATLALGLLTRHHAEAEAAEDAEAVEAAEAWRADVRASVVQWQLSLSRDGRPHRESRHRRAQHAMAGGRVLTLLAEVPEYQTHSLLADASRYLDWLRKLPPFAAWLEANRVQVLVEGSVLVRRAELLEYAQEACRRLLRRQHEEGWFPERGGVDLGRHGLTIDALARVHAQTGWPELEPVLRSATEFLCHFVTPDGRVGNSFNTCGGGFLCPYGAELLQARIPAAGVLSRAQRKACLKLGADRLLDRSAELIAWLAPSFALALMVEGADPMAGMGAAERAVETTAGCSFEAFADLTGDDATGSSMGLRGSRIFSGAGLTVHTTCDYLAVASGRKGGSISVLWREGEDTVRGGRSLEDEGVIVAGHWGLRASGRPGSCPHPTLYPDGLRARGRLRGVRREARGPERNNDPLASLARFVLKRWQQRTAQGRQPAAWQTWLRRRLLRLDRGVPAGRYQREVRFEPDRVMIMDAVRVRGHAWSLLLQTPLDVRGQQLADGTAADHTPPPICVDMSTHVSVTRTYRDGKLTDLRLGTPLPNHDNS
jgi:hypothetical protein